MLTQGFDPSGMSGDAAASLPPTSSPTDIPSTTRGPSVTPTGTAIPTLPLSTSPTATSSSPTDTYGVTPPNANRWSNFAPNRWSFGGNDGQGTPAFQSLLEQRRGSQDKAKEHAEIGIRRGSLGETMNQFWKNLGRGE
ncbi:hypothetical protein SAICODRAFT_28986 [Saitoella complicata NRRL Y-17804]|uniref:uncharacterized protein n=1 Tax=Saitoella complicata (strain BCRC 22490 / CBS 7301 / JCM 7358 / NBRC 10748 / NRRL Y-17804) TaxID=698492 RepID=UPI000866DBD6|nr:uncharacterized protein SAICODRAFT_28986 [Saitoella complicata NRRL Y-17804]ODQ55343.1 hypothetical protein SAICODRAFT_28986 [Saitoella complicata NRRL Y-17804]